MEFMPKREHARFCSARCRVAWNRENWNLVNRDQQKWGSENWDDGDRRPGTEPSALGWALVAMRDTTDRLGKVRAGDRAQAFAVIGEAVWWVTIVDATLVQVLPRRVRQRAGGAARVAAAGDRGHVRRPAVRAEPDGLLRRSRRLHPAPAGRRSRAATRRSPSGPGGRCPPPTLETLPPRGQEWELSRYRAYQDRLAGRPIGETFALASAFLTLVASQAGAAALGA